MTYIDHMHRSIGFFARDTWQQPNGAIPSLISAKGDVEADEVHTVAFSRLIYGLAHLCHDKPRYKDMARKAIEFQLTHMIGEHKDGPYFKPAVSFEGVSLEDESTLDFWQQCYGLTGLTEYYRVTRDPEILPHIHRLFDSFIARFRDPDTGGLVNSVSLEDGQRSEARSFMSLVYPVTAFMLNLALADAENQPRYAEYLLEHLRIAVEQPIWNDTAGWVNVEFDANWLVDGERAPAKLDFTVYPGHCFQLSWFLLKVSALPFVPEDLRTKATDLATTVAARILAQPCWDETPAGGFFAAVDPNTGAVVDNNKIWWQHCEAIIALSAVRDTHAKALSALEGFYFANFLDAEDGGEFFALDAHNRPVTDMPKGEKGKSIYHHIEMLRYLHQDELA